MFYRIQPRALKAICLSLSLCMLVSFPVQAQKEAARPAEAPAKPPAPEKSATKKSASAKEAAGKSNDKSETKSVIRLLELSGNYVDLMQPLSFDPTSLLTGAESLKKKSFYRLCEYLSELGDEKRVSHVVFDLSDPGLSMNPAQLSEITRRLSKLKSTGKHTIAWLENPTNVHLALASACDEVVLADFGVIDMPSLSMHSLFFRDAMDFFGIQASVVRAGDFKGAVEPFLNPQMSEHLREHYLAMLASINDDQVERIAQGRGLSAAQVRDLQKQRMVLPQEALERGLVDRLAAYGTLQPTIEDMIGQSLEWTKPKATPKREMSVFELMGRLMSGEQKNGTTAKQDSIVVLHLSGPIEDGKEEIPGVIVSGPTVKSIEAIGKDENIKAVVVRINSPGGSATASEAIRRALVSLAEKKPMVVSMGEMAASGGYWISCIGQPIYAEKGTITGSIGVFSLKISLGSLFRRLGIHVEALALDEAANSDAIDRPWSEHDQKSMQAFVDDVYEKFLKLVSESRSIPVDELRQLAGGRVWSGSQAKEHKLVDAIGGLDDCLAAVAQKAKLDKYETIHRPVVKSGLDLLELLGEEDPSDIGVRGVFSSKGLQAILAQGFDLTVTHALVRSALQPEGSGMRAWALCPDEFAIR